VAKGTSKAHKIEELLEAGLATGADWPAKRAAQEALRKLPPGVPKPLVARCWSTLVTHPMAYHSLRKTPDAYLDAVLDGLKGWHAPAATFLIHAAGEAPSPTDVRAANRAFYELEPREPFAPKGRASIRGVMANSRFLAAAQNVVAVFGWQGDARMFARALMFEGGKSSVDLLRPIVVAAAERGGQERTDLLGYVRFIESPEMRELFGLLGTDDTVQKRQERMRQWRAQHKALEKKRLAERSNESVRNETAKGKA
jgi:hypothetical protein